MSKRYVLTLVLCIASFAPRAAFAQAIDPALRADVEKLLVATGSANLAAQMASAVSNQLIDGMRQQKPQIPERAAEIIKQTLADEYAKWAAAPDGLQAKTVAIYARHFTHAEIKELLAFYESPIGRKAVAELPTLMQEGIAVGQEWAQANMPRIMNAVQEKLRAEGLLE